MNKPAKTQKRWMKSILKTSSEATPALPFARGQRRAAAKSAPRLLRSA